MGPTGNKEYGSMSEINVTPLVDVMLVLLIIFMVTAPMLQQGVDVLGPLDVIDVAHDVVVDRSQAFVGLALQRPRGGRSGHGTAGLRARHRS